MPYLELPPDLKLYYEINDYTDPWDAPETVLLVHGAVEPALAAVLDEVEHPYRFPLVRAYLSKSHSAVVLVDSARLEAGDREPEFQSLKMLSYLCELNDHRKRGWGNRPVEG